MTEQVGLVKEKEDTVAILGDGKLGLMIAEGKSFILVYFIMVNMYIIYGLLTTGMGLIIMIAEGMCSKYFSLYIECSPWSVWMVSVDGQCGWSVWSCCHILMKLPYDL